MLWPANHHMPSIINISYWQHFLRLFYPSIDLVFSAKRLREVAFFSCHTLAISRHTSVSISVLSLSLWQTFTLIQYTCYALCISHFYDKNYEQTSTVDVMVRWQKSKLCHVTEVDMIRVSFHWHAKTNLNSLV